jgi:valyl-tRNA synthetase
MNGADVDGALPAAADRSAADRWILSRLGAVVAEVDRYYDDFEFAKLADTLFHFTWDEVFDWYVELCKTMFAAGGPAADRSRRVLGEVMDVVLRLLHPLMPYVTEELWTTLTGRESIVIAEWPSDAGSGPGRRWPPDAAAEDEIAAVRRLVTEIRRFRSDQGLQPGQRIPARLTLDTPKLAAHENAIHALARLERADEGFAPTATLTVPDAVIAIDLSGTIDVAAERRRLAKDLLAAEHELASTELKLGNEAFSAKAPERIVSQIRARRDAAEQDIARITAQLANLPA